MKKKTVLVETSKVGKQWSIKVTCSGRDLYNHFGMVVRAFAGEADLTILNATDPFGDTISKRKRKIHKPVMGPATDREEVLKS